MGPLLAALLLLVPLPTGTDVDYQLGGVAAVPDHVGIVVRDRTAEPAAGRYNVCYVNGFQTQPDAKRFWLARRDLLLRDGRGRVVAGWDGTRVGFDFAVAEECGRYDECAAYTAAYGDRVIVVEYRARDFEKTCAGFGDRLAVVLRDRDLTPDGVRRWC